MPTGTPPRTRRPGSTSPRSLEFVDEPPRGLFDQTEELLADVGGLEGGANEAPLRRVLGAVELDDRAAQQRLDLLRVAFRREDGVLSAKSDVLVAGQHVGARHPRGSTAGGRRA